MLAQQVQQSRAGMLLPHSSYGQPADWRTAAIAAYRATEQDMIVTMRAALASRVLAFTGYRVQPTSIVIESDSHVATVALDGVVFRLRQGNLVLVRPCDACGYGECESPPLVELADLGHALADWEPHCAHCPEGNADDAASSL